jgi:hypothetical protein
MRRVVILALLLLSAGCSSTSAEKPSWFPNTDIYFDSQKQFFDNKDDVFSK